MRNRHAISSAARAVSLAVAVAAFAALAAGCPPRLFTYEKEYVVSFESGLKEFERREFPLDKITLYTFPLCEWEKPDSVFGGWAEELDGSTDGSARYQPGEHIMVERNMRFVAVWEFELRIFYDGDDSDKGRAPVDELVYVEYEQATVQGNTRSLQKTGYTFSGWTGVSPSSGSLPDDSWTVSPYQPYRADVVYREGDTFLITGNVTLYPYWEEGRFWLSYDKNGADSGGTPTDSAKYGAGDWAVAADAPEGMTRAGYVFSGWNTKP
ncbi:InlB B-repeat-containing protein, partial [Treponema endosymbiont of Eucomonympha sp.]|uniref:InlB B-repeat-containing protein n=1 Tax=Treponema endosymbiont of Eucomonympha sp. TaxID=1580831 RepID=UPI000A4CD31E